jgi:hypothetical protein
MNFVKTARMRPLLFIVLFLLSRNASAQKIESIYFNLYTDSLKKGFYNYINVDGKCADGTWLPLDSTHIRLTANTGYFKGNDIFIDSSYTGDTIRVKAVLKRDPSIRKEVVIYIRKRGFDEPLKTDDEILDGLRKKKKSGN